MGERNFPHELCPGTVERVSGAFDAHLRDNSQPAALAQPAGPSPVRGLGGTVPLKSRKTGSTLNTMGVFLRRVLPSFLSALAFVVCAHSPVLAAGPGVPLQTALRDKIFSSLEPEQRQGLSKASPIEPMISRLDPAQRQAAAAKLAPLEKQFSDAQSLNEIGKVYLKLGLTEEAARLAAELKAKHPDSALGAMLEAKAKQESGDTAGALVSAKAAAMQEPENAEVMAYFKLLRNGGGQTTKVALAGSAPVSKVEPEGNPNPTMDVNQRRRVNNALAVLMTSSNGKRIVLAVVPGADGPVTEADLAKHGIHLRMRQDAKRGEPLSSVSSGTAPGGGRVVVIAFQNAVIDERNDIRDMAALFGGDIDQVGYQDKVGWKLPSVLLDWRKRVARAYVLVELKVDAFATRASSAFSQELRVNARILEGNVSQTKVQDGAGEFYSELFEKIRGTLGHSESNFGVRGIDLVYLADGLLNNNRTDIQLSRAYPDYVAQKKSVSEDLRRDFQSP